MLGSIIEINNNVLYVRLDINLNSIQNIIHNYVFIDDIEKNFVGEVVNIKDNIAEINILGEYNDKNYTDGYSTKPSFSAKISLVPDDLVKNIIGIDQNNLKKILLVGKSNVYDDVQIGADINKLFGSHFALFGSTGSGKSWGLARLIQNLFCRKDMVPLNSNVVIFDAYGEYKNAFSGLNQINSGINYKNITTNVKSNDELLKIPLWLLDVDDIALLLNAEKTIQLPVIEKALKLVAVFKKEETEVKDIKNYILAKCLIDVTLSGKPAAQVRDQFFAILSRFNTSDLSLDSQIIQPGYIRTLRQCLLIEETNKIRAIETVYEFLEQFVNKEIDLTTPLVNFKYDLKDLIDAFDFALIDEGAWNSNEVYDLTNTLRIRLQYLYQSDYKHYFELNEYLSLDNFVEKLFRSNNGGKAQLLNFNINYVDDRFAKTVTKIFSKILFTFSKNLPNRASMPFNIILEEAHRYVQNDSDVNIIGYNIFERICKEGRKYGVLLGFISQRPSELSETCLSQCSNFFLFKMSHPIDISYIEEIVPNITDEIVERMKTLQPGICMCFGNAFKITSIIKLDKPYPTPSSDNADILNIWYS